jgi:hypothetical protein
MGRGAEVQRRRSRADLSTHRLGRRIVAGLPSPVLILTGGRGNPQSRPHRALSNTVGTRCQIWYNNTDSMVTPACGQLFGAHGPPARLVGRPEA